MKNWFLVRTKPLGEEKAQFNLKRQGFEVYLPRYAKTRRHARKTETVFRPLFPSYLFVRFDTEISAWRSISSTIGVASLVTFGPCLSPVDPSIIEGLRERENEHGLVSLMPTGIKKGDRVRVVDGPFTNFAGLIEEVNDSQRVILLLELMGRSVRITADADTISAA